MTLKQNVKIIKVPLTTKEKNIDRPQVFPRMPRLYLELLENKSKIKQDLINTEYNPKKSISPYENKNSLDAKLDNYLNENSQKEEKKRDQNKDVQTQLDSNSEDENIEEDVADNTSQKEDDIQVKNKVRDKVKVKDKNKVKDKVKNRVEDEVKDEDSDSDSNYNKKDKYTEDNDADNEYKNEQDDNVKDDEDDTVSVLSNKSEDTHKSDGSSVDNLEDRLNSLLDDKDDDNLTVVTEKSKKKDKYSRQRDFNKYSVKKEKNMAPSLAELEAQGGYTRKNVLRDINNVPYSEQEEEDLKREIMFKIELLKKSYPNSTIPEFSIHSDYKSMKKIYDDTVRRLSLDSTVESYKTYLIGGFMACEFIFGNFLKLDMTGFTQQQILTMNSYEKLLIELGEKSYVPTGSKWPVEVRLLFMIIMNAAFFVISKMIMKKTGANLMGMINSMNVSSQPQPKKRRMNGPNIDISNLPDN
jgi:hypothetical protein